MKLIVAGFVAGVLSCAVLSRAGDRRQAADRGVLGAQLAEAEARAADSAREALAVRQQLVRVREGVMARPERPPVQPPPPPESPGSAR